MPLYEYKCRQCDHRFEQLVRASETPACPTCNAAQPEKLFSVFAVSGGQGDPPPRPAGCGGCSEGRTPGACPMAG